MSEKQSENEVFKICFSEPQPILREAKVVQGERKTTKTAIGGGYGLEVRDKLL